MRYPSRETIQRVKSRYPKGTRVKLIKMDDPYTKLQSGATGTVIHVDDIGTIHVSWDNGEKLGIVYGEDSVEII